MKILSLDSSGLVASVAIIEDDILIAEYTVNHKKTHSQTLMVMLDEIVKTTELDIASVDAIAVAGGPGSFTGLRIGSASAKGLAMALDIPIVSVPTVDALAYNLFGCEKVICPMMDARREQVYTGLYTFENGADFKTLLSQDALGLKDICDQINAIGKEVIILGDAVPVYRDKIAEYLSVPFVFAPASVNRQRAASVAALGMEYFKAGRIQSASEHAPEYLRKSQAERMKDNA